MGPDARPLNVRIVRGHVPGEAALLTYVVLKTNPGILKPFTRRRVCCIS